MSLSKSNMPAMSKFSARPSALGYMYQVRYALYSILSSENADIKLHIEALDDIQYNMDLHKPLMEMEFNGILTDPEGIAKVKKEYEEELVQM